MASESFCGGCGETDPAKRCVGCLGDFSADIMIIVCEPCGHDAGLIDRRDAEKAGWAECWDGWVCPECRKEFPDGE